MEAFEYELIDLLNKHSIENKVDMPDFLLARLLCQMIETIGPVFKNTLTWHGCDSIMHPKEDVKQQQDLYTNFNQK